MTCRIHSTSCESFPRQHVHCRVQDAPCTQFPLFPTSPYYISRCPGGTNGPFASGYLWVYVSLHLVRVMSARTPAATWNPLSGGPYLPDQSPQWYGIGPVPSGVILIVDRAFEMDHLVSSSTCKKVCAFCCRLRCVCHV